MNLFNEKISTTADHKQFTKMNDRYEQDGNPTFNSLNRIGESQLAESKEKRKSSMNIGIADMDRQKMAEGLGTLLSDSYLLYLKTHNYHWNVAGPLFFTLHGMFMLQYTELALAVDAIAERIRSLGVAAPGTFLEFKELATIKEKRGVLSAEQMVASLNSDQEILIRTIRDLLKVANQLHDFTTSDLLTQRLQVHEKNAWMLRSLLND